MVSTTKVDSGLSLQHLNAYSQIQGEINRPQKTNDPDKAWKAAQEFENMFVTQVIQELFEDIGKDGLFGAGESETMFRTFFAESMAQSFNKSFGIADMVFKNLITNESHGSEPVKSANNVAYYYTNTIQGMNGSQQPGKEVYNVTA